MGMFTNPLSYAGYPPGVTGTPTTQNTTVRAATADEVNDGVLDNVYVSPATAQAEIVADFASPPPLGSTAPNTVASTTLTSSGNTTLATAASATTATILSAIPGAGVDRTFSVLNAASGEDDTINFMTGANTAGNHIFNVLTGNITGGTSRLDLFAGNISGGTNSFNIFNNASSSGGTLSINLGTGARAVTINIGTGAPVNPISIGGAASTLGFFSATPVVKAISTKDLKQTLVDYGLYTDGGATPLDLDGGIIDAGFGRFTTTAASAGIAVDANSAAGTGVAGKFTSSAATVDSIEAVTGSIKVPATSVSGASPVVNNVRTGQASFTDVIANGAYGTLTVTDSIVTGASTVVIASVSCSTANSALQIVEIAPSAGSVAFRIFNAGSASTAANILVNFWVLN